MRKVIETIVMLLLAVLLAGGFAVVVLEWLAGCGESYVDAYGNTHQYECLFINNKE